MRRIAAKPKSSCMSNCVAYRVAFVVAILLPFCAPGGIVSGSVAGISINGMFQGGRFLAIALFFVFCDKGKLLELKMNKIIALCMLMGFGYSVAHFFAGDHYYSARFLILFPSFAIMLQYLAIYYRSDLVRAITLLSGAWLLAEAVTVVLYYPSGLNNYQGYWFDQTLAGAQYWLGGKNQIYPWAIVFLVFYSVDWFYRHGKLPNTTIGFGIALLILAAVLNSAGTVVCIVLFIITYFFVFRPHLHVFVSAKMLFPLAFVFVAAVIAGIASNSEVVGWLVESFGRDATFTNRSFIWERFFDVFLSNPITGNPNSVIVLQGTEITQSHNAYIQVMYSTGLLGLIPFALLIVICAKRVSILSHSSCIACLFVIALFNVLIHSSFEPLDDYVFLLIINVFSSQCIAERERVPKGKVCYARRGY